VIAATAAVKETPAPTRAGSGLAKPATGISLTLCQSASRDGSGLRRGWKDRPASPVTARSKNMSNRRQPRIFAIRRNLRLRLPPGCLSCRFESADACGPFAEQQDQVSCTTCHKIRPANGPFPGLVARKAASVNAQCATCLRTGVSFKAFKHRLPEGAMSTVDCHNPTGLQAGMIQIFAASKRLLPVPGDKRTSGPSMRLYASKVADCHEPHGSANPRMLVRREVRLVCLKVPCQSAGSDKTSAVMGVVPPAFHDLRSPRFRNCTCHQKIHESRGWEFAAMRLLLFARCYFAGAQAPPKASRRVSTPQTTVSARGN
jgi:hypothetical protein